MEIIGEGRKDLSRIQLSFPLKQLTDRQNFLSLLHYFWLLSIREVVQGVLRLRSLYRLAPCHVHLVVREGKTRRVALSAGRSTSNRTRRRRASPAVATDALAAR